MENKEFFWTFTLAFWSHMYVFDKTRSSLWSVIAGTTKGALKLQNGNNNSRLVQIKGKKWEVNFLIWQTVSQLFTCQTVIYYISLSQLVILFSVLELGVSNYLG